ncbi:unnamed protein product, partial [Didymodactylos carnosus]
MQIFVRGAELIPLDVENDVAVNDIKETIAEEYELEIDNILLSFNGVPLGDDQNLSSFGITPGATIDASVKLFGGKVHGSLARAGKVKGQTPK